MKYLINTYGCQMNIHESEKISGILETLGYLPTEIPEEADIIVFNTCCIRDTAEKKILGNIGQVKKLKAAKPSLKVVVCGCMSQQKGVAESLTSKFPFINVIIGTNELEKLSEYVLSITPKKKRIVSVTESEEIFENIPCTRTSFPNAWVNITFGCNNFCSYCIVPYVRGRERSRRSEEILAEVEGLLKEGYKEITLLGQNVNSYGKTSQNEISFAELLAKTAELPYSFRLRFMTSHPKDLSDDVLEVMASHDKICKCLHLPVQNGSDRILSLMNRHYTRADYFAIIDKARSLMPDIAFTTDLMVGFPTETEEDFLQTLDLVKRVGYSTAFTFVYSPRKGTPAASMEQVSPQIKKDRIERLIALQNEITSEYSKGYIGKEYVVLAEDRSPRRKNCLCGRTESGRLITFEGDKSLLGKFVSVKVTSSASASLFGTFVKEV